MEKKERIYVVAPPDQVCPMQNCAGMIDDKTPVRVPDNRYYRRLLVEGSLQRHEMPVAKSSKQKKMGGDE